jgi:hypothetical protein
MGAQSIMVVDMAWYHWIAFFLSAIIGGAASSFVNNSGMAKMWGWEKQDKENYKLGIIADIIIGIAASIGLLWTMTPQTVYQLLGISAVGGYGGSSVLRALVNKMEGQVAQTKADDAKEESKSNVGLYNNINDLNEKSKDQLTKIKNYLIENNKKEIYKDLYDKKLIE